MLVLWREENQRTRRKTLGARREPTTNSTHVRRRARTVGMVGDKHSHRCAIFASPCGYWVGRQREVRRFSQIKRAAENGLVGYGSIIFFFFCSAVFHSNSTCKGEKRGFKEPTCMVSLFFVRFPLNHFEIFVCFRCFS